MIFAKKEGSERVHVIERSIKGNRTLCGLLLTMFDWELLVEGQVSCQKCQSVTTRRVTAGMKFTHDPEGNRRGWSENDQV